VQYFSDLGYNAENLMITSGKDANDRKLVQRVENCDLIYLTGGNPKYLQQALFGSKLWASILLASQYGMGIAGSSAGAMVLGGLLKNPEAQTWGIGLNLINRLGVIPHHENSNPEEVSKRLMGSVFDQYESSMIIGISIESGCLIRNDNLEVIGNSPLTLYTSDTYIEYETGSKISL